MRELKGRKHAQNIGIVPGFWERFYEGSGQFAGSNVKCFQNSEQSICFGKNSAAKDSRGLDG